MTRENLRTPLRNVPRWILFIFVFVVGFMFHFVIGLVNGLREAFYSWCRELKEAMKIDSEKQ